MNVISPEELRRGPLEDTFGTDVGLSGIVLVYKRWGDTPLQTLTKLKRTFPILEQTVLSYAGRLDPLAEGLLLVLVGDENKKREEYLHLDKVYEFDTLFGVTSDTGDIFGILNYDPSMSEPQYTEKTSRTHIELGMEKLKGNQEFVYPIYSSKTVYGIPLFQLAKDGLVHDGYITFKHSDGCIEYVPLPTRKVTVHSLFLEQEYTVSLSDFVEKCNKALSIVSGEFRYDDIKKSLECVLASKIERFKVCTIRCTSSSGTYMRTLAEHIGKHIGVPSLAYRIKRVSVGEYSLSDERVVYLD